MKSQMGILLAVWYIATLPSVFGESASTLTARVVFRDKSAFVVQEFTFWESTRTSFVNQTVADKKVIEDAIPLMQHGAVAQEIPLSEVESVDIYCHNTGSTRVLTKSRKSLTGAIAWANSYSPVNWGVDVLSARHKVEGYDAWTDIQISGLGEDDHINIRREAGVLILSADKQGKETRTIRNVEGLRFKLPNSWSPYNYEQASNLKCNVGEAELVIPVGDIKSIELDAKRLTTRAGKEFTFKSNPDADISGWTTLDGQKARFCTFLGEKELLSIVFE